MRTFYPSLMLFLGLLFSQFSYSQSTTISLNYTGGGCIVCSGNYACYQGPFSPTWTIKEFMDPIPPNHILTSIEVRIYGVGCGANSVQVELNGTSIGSTPVFGNCSCGTCSLYSLTSNNAHQLYNYGSINGLFLRPTDGNMCVDRVEVTINYEILCNVTVDAGSNQTVYYGYAPYATATLNANITGGTAPINVQWYDDNNNNVGSGMSVNVSPSTGTTYRVDVLDANNCPASAEVTVCVVDVTCGNNGDKVEVCHIPPGNPNKAKTICISAEDVADHLAHGDLLGSCDEQPGPCNGPNGPALVVNRKTASSTDVFVPEYRVNSYSSEEEYKVRSVDFQFTSDGNPSLQIGQNLTSGSFSLRFGALSDAYGTINLMGPQGNVVDNIFSGNITSGQVNQMEYSTDDLPSGIYICQFIVDDRSTIEKVIITK